MDDTQGTSGSFVSHLESAIDGTRLEARRLHTMHNDRPLWVRYDLDTIRRTADRDALVARKATMWRYRELLPYEDKSQIVSLGETMTPLLRCDRLGSKMGLNNLFIKDESRLPTGSFKARGMAMAVTMAASLGQKRLAAPTAGNAGGALTAYATRAGLESFVFMPADTPMVNRYEARLYGGRAFVLDGLITDCGAIVQAGKKRMGWFDVSTLKEPYRIEGKKTMGLELAEQFDWKLPDAVFYPTGGGTGLIGMHKAFHELEALGWLDSDTKPRLFACQSDGCAPIVHAFKAGERFATPPDHPHTRASGLRVPKAVGDFMILDAVRESNGRAVAAEEQRINEWMNLACASEGVALCPETAICIGALEHAVRHGTVDPDEQIVVFNTGAAQKYIEVIERDLPKLDVEHVDWDWIDSRSM